MALDGLSNQSVGIYRTKDNKETTDKLTARSKEAAERYFTDIEDSAVIEQTDPDGKGNANEQQQMVLSQANKLIEDEDETQVLQLTTIDENPENQLVYTVKFNSETKMIEMTNFKTGELIEKVHPDELLKILHKAKNFSGMFIDKEI